LTVLVDIRQNALTRQRRELASSMRQTKWHNYS